MSANWNRDSRALSTFAAARPIGSMTRDKIQHTYRHRSWQTEIDRAGGGGRFLNRLFGGRTIDGSSGHGGRGGRSSVL
jgi:hypothetical protein